MPPSAHAERSTFRAAYEALLAGEHPWDTDDGGGLSVRASEKANAAPRSQYMLELLRWPVERGTILELLSDVSPHALLDERHVRRRDNITGVWKEALHVWAAQAADAERVAHAIDTLEALACALLPKTYTNYTLDVITLLAGRMDDADDVFYTLVGALDRTLRHAPRQAGDTTAVAQQQHSALRLAIVFAACTGSTSLRTYLLHADLFAAAMLNVQTNGTVTLDMLCETALLTALLATSGVAHGISPSASGVMRHAALQPYQRRLREYNRMRDVAHLAHACSAKAAHILSMYRRADSAPTRSSWSFDWLYTEPAPHNAHAEFPPPSAWLLFATWVWIHSNDAFVTCMLDALPSKANTPAIAPLIVSYISLASFALTHAASSARATAYAHTILQSLLVLLGSPTATTAMSKRLLADEDTLEPAHRFVPLVMQCRDKPGALPVPPKSGTKRPRRLVVCILNNAVSFLKFNRSKRLDAQSFHTSLRIVQRVALLCADAHILLEYDWIELWRTLLMTCEFVATRHAELGDNAAHVLAPSLLDSLAVLLALSDKFLQTPAETHLLLYELARSKATLEKLAILAGDSAHTSWALLSELLHTIDMEINTQRENARASSLIPNLFRDRSQEPVSMHTILGIIQRMDLSALLAPDKPVCVAIVRLAHENAANGNQRGSGLSPSAALLRIVQHDWLLARSR